LFLRAFVLPMLSLAVMAGLSGSAQAGRSLFEIERDRMELLRTDRGTAERLQRPERRKRFVALTEKGGVVRPILAGRAIGCDSIESFGRYLDFYFDGIGEIPSGEECRAIDVGATVKIKECDERFLVCRFSEGFFGRHFWTYIVAVDPR
jgi:hypothetical protein